MIGSPLLLLVTKGLEAEGRLQFSDRPLSHAVAGVVVMGVDGGMRLFLERTSPPPDSLAVVGWLLLFWFQFLVVDAPQVGVLQFNVFEFGWENVHFAAVFEDNMAIQVD